MSPNFFFTDAEIPPLGHYEDTDYIFNGDCIMPDWLARHKIMNVAVDHTGRLITNGPAIIKTVEDSLKLPRATPGITRADIWNDNHINSALNVRLADFPTPCTALKNADDEIRLMSFMGLVIPKCLYGDYLAETQKAAAKAWQNTKLNRH